MRDAQLFLQPKLIPTRKHFLNYEEKYGEMVKIFVGLRPSIAIRTLYGKRSHPLLPAGSRAACRQTTVRYT
jgi:hypothetical protein